MTSGTAAGDELAERYAREDDFDAGQLAHMAWLIEAAGGREWAGAQAAERLAAAHGFLHRAVPEPERARDLLSLADLITTRDH